MATGPTPVTPAMLEGPLLPPPPGVTPNFNAVNTYHFRLLHVMIAMIVLSATFIAMRLYTKIAITRQLWWDDLTCVLSFPFTVGFGAVTILETNVGLGKHVWDIQLGTWLEKDFHLFDSLNVVTYTLYMVAQVLIKMSILLLYHKLLAPGMKLRFTVFGVMAFVALAYTSTILSLLFGCRPLSRLFDPTTPGTCINIFAQSAAQGILNIVTDVMIFLVPIPMVWSMQMKLKHKVGVVAIFVTGLAVTALSIYRLVDLFAAESSTDITVTQSQNTIISVIELNLAIITSCMPAFKPFLRNFLPWLRAHSTTFSRTPKSNPSFVRSIPKSSKSNPHDAALTKDSGLVEEEYVDNGDASSGVSDAEKNAGRNPRDELVGAGHGGQNIQIASALSDIPPPRGY